MLRELRMKAKDVGNLKEDNERLKQQILELRESATKAASAAGNEQVCICVFLVIIMLASLAHISGYVQGSVACCLPPVVVNAKGSRIGTSKENLRY